MNTDKTKTLTPGPSPVGRARGMLLLAFLFLPVAATLVAQDINKGYTFSPNEQNVTHTKLNNLVDLATINPTFITTKPVIQPAGADSFIIYSAGAGGLRRVTYSDMYLSNTNLIAAQSETSTPATNDYLLLLSGITGLYEKATLNSIWTNNDLINSRSELTNPPLPNAQFLVSSNGQYYRIGLSNLYSEWWRWEKFSTNTYYDVTPTNTSLLSLHTHPTNADMIRIWDAHAGTNRAITLASLITNLPAATLLTNTDVILLFSTVTNAANPYGTNGVISKATLPTLATGLTNGMGLSSSNQLPITFTTNVPLAAATVKNVDHLLPGTPQVVRWVLVCTNADLAYAVGDEIDAASGVATSSASGDNAAYLVGANATQCWIAQNNDNVFMPQRTSTSRLTITPSKWNLKCRAVYYPQ